MFIIMSKCNLFMKLLSYKIMVTVNFIDFFKVYSRINKWATNAKKQFCTAHYD